MAVVIPFQPRPRPSAAGGPREGLILFFTGVRYERMPEAISTSARPPKRRPASRRPRTRQPA